eukprot:TRINITY_DN1204_c0_g2_i1.p1 TRINITY_DN1204_c0_g2~~TRINITY_DN1204_c0_g2_i1.p1  ORF type:complete len:200 (-),score=39.81 TRINITY_DN1204_c0_g2_i1:671-1270(-)
MVKVTYLEDLRGYFLEEFLDEEECRQLIESAEEKGFDFCFETKRHCLRLRFHDSQLAQKISDRLFQILELEKLLYACEENQEIDENTEERLKATVGAEFRICKYTEGHSFGVHLDLSKKVGNKRTRYTLMVYLNDDFEGGKTHFLKSQIIEPAIIQRVIVPARGAVLLFPQDADDLPHMGAEVTLGTKYILRIDLLFDE